MKKYRWILAFARMTFFGVLYHLIQRVLTPALVGMGRTGQHFGCF
jgi:hypothetical protein